MFPKLLRAYEGVKFFAFPVGTSINTYGMTEQILEEEGGGGGRGEGGGGRSISGNP